MSVETLPPPATPETDPDTINDILKDIKPEVEEMINELTTEKQRLVDDHKLSQETADKKITGIASQQCMDLLETAQTSNKDEDRLKVWQFTARITEEMDMLNKDKYEFPGQQQIFAGAVARYPNNKIFYEHYSNWLTGHAYTKQKSDEGKRQLQELKEGDFEKYLDIWKP